MRARRIPYPTTVGRGRYAGPFAFGARMVDLHDVVALLGLISFAAGIWWIYPPAALIAVGVLFLMAAVVGRPSRGDGR